jgi:protein O-GlcNAc transferase
MTQAVDDLVKKYAEHVKHGRLQAAEQTCLQIIERDETHAPAHHELGSLLQRRGDRERAIQFYQRAAQLDPTSAIFHNSLGMAYSIGNVAHEAAASFKRAIEANPDLVTPYVNLAKSLRVIGQPGDAVNVCRQALVVEPENVDARFVLAITLNDIGRSEEAVEIFRSVIALNPDYTGVHNNLAIALMRLGRFAEGIASCREAIVKEPRSALPHNTLGNALKAQFDLHGAMQSFRAALAIKPDYPKCRSNVLLTMNYLPDVTQAEIYAEAREFEVHQCVQFANPHRGFPNAADKQKKLKIGYVSPDFRGHSVAYFTKSLITAHDREQVEVYAYANVLKQDDMTRVFEAGVDHWVSIIGLSDADVAERIRADEIDILVDLAGHTGQNRLLVFAHRPAPVQVAWLGYPNTTGMDAMEYRLTDEYADPPGDEDRAYAEKLIRLEGGFLCYQADDLASVVSAPPSLQNDYVTFGSFNVLEKLNPEVIRVWSAILQRVPESRLTLKAKVLNDEVARDLFLQQFSDHGIGAERINLLAWSETRELHLGTYSGIDIGLDPFPYNGTTTTCEALWMGVPVITVLGDRHAGRVGASLLHQVGMRELIANDEAAYIELAVSLATQPEKLTTLRNEMRARMAASTLMDVDGFTHRLEQAYRRMWVTWCETNAGTD